MPCEESLEGWNDVYDNELDQHGPRYSELPTRHAADNPQLERWYRNFRRRASRRQLTTYETETTANVTQDGDAHSENKVIESTADIAEQQRSNEGLSATMR